MNAEEYAQWMAGQMSEETLQAKVEDLAQRLGWRKYHTHDSRRSDKGFPDLVLVHAGRGRVLYRELKKQTGRVTKEQKEWLADLTAAGQDAGLWRPVHWFDRTIEKELLT